MKSNLYQIYQGEDLDIIIKAKERSGEYCDISNIEISVALIMPSKNKIILSTKSGSLEINRLDLFNARIHLSALESQLLAPADYSLSIMLTIDNRRVIEQVELIRVLTSLHGKE